MTTDSTPSRDTFVPPDDSRRLHHWEAELIIVNDGGDDASREICLLVERSADVGQVAEIDGNRSVLSEQPPGRPPHSGEGRVSFLLSLA